MLKDPENSDGWCIKNSPKVFKRLQELGYVPYSHRTNTMAFISLEGLGSKDYGKIIGSSNFRTTCSQLPDSILLPKRLQLLQALTRIRNEV